MSFLVVSSAERRNTAAAVNIFIYVSGISSELVIVD